MTAEPSDNELRITRSFAAPAALLFRLWTEPAHLVRWMGPHDFDCPHAEVDLRVGGAYRVLIRSGHRGDNWFGGVYRQIEPGRRLVFTFIWDNDGPAAGVETLVTITFAERDGRTVQTFHQAPFSSAERRDSHIGGWTQVFEKLDGYAATIVGKQAA
jgi:uncharacterized protein YndB with AHSA1/START domain